MPAISDIVGKLKITPKEIITVKSKPTFAANFLGPALTICTGTFPYFNPNFIVVQTGLNLIPKNILIIKSNADRRITSLNGVNKNKLIIVNVKIE